MALPCAYSWNSPPRFPVIRVLTSPLMCGRLKSSTISALVGSDQGLKEFTAFRIVRPRGGTCRTSRTSAFWSRVHNGTPSNCWFQMSYTFSYNGSHSTSWRLVLPVLSKYWKPLLPLGIYSHYWATKIPYLRCAASEVHHRTQLILPKTTHNARVWAYYHLLPSSPFGDSPRSLDVACERPQYRRLIKPNASQLIYPPELCHRRLSGGTPFSWLWLSTYWKVIWRLCCDSTSILIVWNHYYRRYYCTT